MESFTAVIPTLNEERNVDEVIEKVQKFGDAEVIVVDDGSTDRTREVACEHGAEVIHRKERRSLSLSVLEGLEAATNEKVVVMDGDGQHPPEKAGEVLELLDRHELVVVSRRAVQGKWAFYRKLMSFGAEALAKALLPCCRKMKDPISGFFGVRKSSLNIEDMEPRGYKILLELIARHELDLGEIDYVFLQRENGNSSIGPRSIANFLLHILELKYRQVKKDQSQ